MDLKKKLIFIFTDYFDDYSYIGKRTLFVTNPAYFKMPKVASKKTTKATEAVSTPAVEEKLAFAEPVVEAPKKGKKTKKVEEVVAPVETVPEPEAEPEAEADGSADEKSATTEKLSYLEKLQKMKIDLENENKQDLALMTLLKERLKTRKEQISTVSISIKLASKEADKKEKKEAKKSASGEEKTGAKNSGVFKKLPVINEELVKFIEENHLVPSSAIKKKTKQEVPCIAELVYNEDGQLVISKSELQSLWCSVVEHMSLKDINSDGKSTKFIKYEGSPFQAFLGDQYNDDEDDETNRLTYTKFFGAMKGLLDTTKPYVEATEEVAE